MESFGKGDRTRDYLKDILQHIYEGFEQGNVNSLSQFEADGEDLQTERHLSTMRYKTRVFLEKKEYSVADLAMHGLHVSYKGYQIKILKEGHDGKAPIAGRSQKRLSFYNHNYGQGLLPMDDTYKIIEDLELENRRHLVVLYKVNKSGHFTGLDLVCTESANHRYGSPLISWKSAVPHPATFGNAYEDKYEELTREINTFELDKEDDRKELPIFSKTS